MIKLKKLWKAEEGNYRLKVIIFKYQNEASRYRSHRWRSVERYKGILAKLL